MPALLVWSAFGILFGGQLHWIYAGSGRPISWRLALSTALLEWYLWGALSPLILFLARRFPLERGRVLVSLPAHVLAGAFLASLHIVIVQSVLVATGIWRDWETRAGFPTGLTMQRLESLHIMRFHSNALIYFAIVGCAHAMAYGQRLREREVRAAALETQLLQAQLQALRTQLHPHFLFNTLNTIAALIPKDALLAERMVERLAELLRAVLKGGATQFVTLREELEFLDGYLEIEQARFPDRLGVLRDVEPAALEARVPSLILQPLVENAVRHGIASRAEPGRVTIRARRDHEALVLEVRDTGPGLAEEVPGAGVGLPNTRERLRRLYGTGFRMELENTRGLGLGVVLRIPWAEAG
jgi:two-component system LytT family sensor kinase